MTENSTQEVVKDLEEYKFGFHDNAELEFTTGLGVEFYSWGSKGAGAILIKPVRCAT